MSLHPNNATNRSLLDTAGSVVSVTAAVSAAFVLQPFAQDATAAYVANFAAEHYGDWIVWLVRLLWWCITAGAIGAAVLLACKIILSGGTVSALIKMVRR